MAVIGVIGKQEPQAARHFMNEDSVAACLCGRAPTLPAPCIDARIVAQPMNTIAPILLESTGSSGATCERRNAVRDTDGTCHRDRYMAIRKSPRFR